MIQNDCFFSTVVVAAVYKIYYCTKTGSSLTRADIPWGILLFSNLHLEEVFWFEWINMYTHPSLFVTIRMDN